MHCLLPQRFAGMQCLPGQRGGGGFFGTDGKGEMMNYRLSMRGGFVAVGFSLLLMQGTFPLSVARGNELVDLRDIIVGMSAQSRCGLEGWDCTGAQPNAQEEPVGGVYVNERCTKAMTGRSVVVERRLFRRPDQDVKTFVDET